MTTTILEQLEANPATAPSTDLGAFVRGFLETAVDELRHVEDDEDEATDALNKTADIDLLSETSLREAIHQCAAFLYLARENNLLPVEGVEDTAFYHTAGYDYFQNRNGAGVGFWDREELYGERQGQLLAGLCGTFNEFPDVSLEWGDDGRLCLYPLTISLHGGYKPAPGILGLDRLPWVKKSEQA